MREAKRSCIKMAISGKHPDQKANEIKKNMINIISSVLLFN
jgi:hypothetical protein